MARLDGTIRGRIESRGPFLDIMVMATHQRVMALKAAGRKPPSPITIRALLDTGASCSALDPLVAKGLGLDPAGRVQVHTPTTGTAYEWRNLYDATVVLGEGTSFVRTFTVGFLDTDLSSEGFLALVGWDILKACVFTCNGPTGTFTLKF
jgi:hypothetical protein